MKPLFALIVLPALGGCVAKAVVDTAVTAVSVPVKVASKTIDLATTSQSEADEKRGREARKADERRGRELREMRRRCTSGQPRPTDDCSRTATP